MSILCIKMIQHIATDEVEVSDLLSSDDSVLSNLWPHAGPRTCKICPIHFLA